MVTRQIFIHLQFLSRPRFDEGYVEDVADQDQIAALDLPQGDIRGLRFRALKI